MVYDDGNTVVVDSWNTDCLAVDTSNQVDTSKIRRQPMKESLELPDKNFFVIDKDHLDAEWERQSVLVYQMGEANATARFEYDSAKRAYDVTRAEVNLDVRRNPAKYGFATKPTEAAIEALVDSNKRVCEAAAAIQKARYELDITSAGMTAADNKKKALESLTQLTAINYYASR